MISKVYRKKIGIKKSENHICENDQKQKWCYFFYIRQGIIQVGYHCLVVYPLYFDVRSKCLSKLFLLPFVFNNNKI